MSFLTEMKKNLNEGIFSSKNVSPNDEEYAYAESIVKKEYGDDASIGGIGVNPKNGIISVEIYMGPDTALKELEITPEKKLR